MKQYEVTIWTSATIGVSADSIEEARRLAQAAWENDGGLYNEQVESINVYEEETGLTYYEDGTIEG